MDNENLKSQAVEKLLNSESQNPGENPHFDRLNAAFGKKSDKEARNPDFNRIRQNILLKRDAALIRRKRVNFFYAPLTAAAILLMSIGILYVSSPGPAGTPEPMAANAIPGKPQVLNFENSLGVHLRNGSGLAQRRVGTSITFEASEISALFQFTPNEKLTKVEIRLPEGIVSVIGTEFILEGARGSLFLAVNSGTVRVSRQGAEFLVHAGEFWSVRAEKQSSGLLDAQGKALFSQFLAAETNSGQKTQPTEKRISIILKSGSVIRGILVSEDAESVSVKIPATGNDLIRFKRDEISQIHHLK